MTFKYEQIKTKPLLVVEQWEREGYISELTAEVYYYHWRNIVFGRCSRLCIEYQVPVGKYDPGMNEDKASKLHLNIPEMSQEFGMFLHDLNMRLHMYTNGRDKVERDEEELYDFIKEHDIRLAHILAGTAPLWAVLRFSWESAWSYLFQISERLEKCKRKYGGTNA